jgi:hypothetical protein
MKGKHILPLLLASVLVLRSWLKPWPKSSRLHYALTNYTVGDTIVKDKEATITKKLLDLALARHDLEPNLTTALCYKTLFGHVSLYQFMNWMAYHHLLGVDHFFVWYFDEIQQLPGWELLSRLNFVTLTPNNLTDDSKVAHGDYNNYRGTGAQTPLEEHCLVNYAHNYDWVTLADFDEFLWFEDYDGIKELLLAHDKYYYLSFGKRMYTPTHTTTIQQTLTTCFGKEHLPFHAGAYCYMAKTERERNMCVLYRARAKVFVRPKRHPRAVFAHGTVSRPNETMGQKVFENRKAHWKEWQLSRNLTVVPPRDFCVASGQAVRIHHFTEATKSNGNGTWTLYYDETLQDWFVHVASRSRLWNRDTKMCREEVGTRRINT